MCKIDYKNDDNRDEIDVKKLVGMRIREYRLKHKMNQETLAEKIGIDNKHLSNIELGRNMPNPQLLLKIATVFDVEIKDLFEIYHLLPEKNLNDAILSLIARLDNEQLRLAYKYIKTFVI